MATMQYSGSISESTGLNTSPSVSLSGSGTASGIINSVTASLYFSTSYSSRTYSVTATLYYAGGSVTSSRSVKMNASEASGKAFDFTFDGLTAEQANSIESIKASCSTNGNTVFLKGSQTVTVNYTVVSKVTAPTTVGLSGESAAPGAKMTLTWSGAEAGENNAITGYNIYRSTTPEGAYSLLSAVSSTATSGSATVTAPTTNGAAYYYKVAAIGTWSGYDSKESVAYATLTCSFDAVSAPTTVSLSATNAAPGAELKLSWSGAANGNNNSIVGYLIYRAEDAEGEYSPLTTVITTATTGSTIVTAPTENNAVYYFKVQTIGTLDGHDSGLSGVYATLTCTYSMPSAPRSVLVDGEASTFAPPDTSVRLSWSGASGGANNAIIGYTVYQDNEVYATDLDASVSAIEVPSHDTAGEQYSYTVVTIGSYSDSAPSLACVVYSYSDPAAPTTITVSKDATNAGERVTLSWSGAEAGGYNNIVGYRVYQATSKDGARTQVAYVSTSTTHSACYVTAPSSMNSMHYYWVETIGSYSVSDISTVYVVIQTIEGAGDDEGGTVVIVPKPTGRRKRGFVFGDYDTAANGWTLTGWEFPEPEPQTSYVIVPGRLKGPLDLSTSLTDGDPRYDNRKLNAIFELSEGTRMNRIEVIGEMVNQLHGMQVEIVLPDDASRYAVGRLSVNLSYNDEAHAEVTVQGVCEPWRYNQQETVISLMATEETNTAVLHNSGRCLLVPEVTVVGGGASVRLTCGGHSWTLDEGNYKLPDLELHKGNTIVTYSGIGSLVFKYREAIL